MTTTPAVESDLERDYIGLPMAAIRANHPVAFRSGEWAAINSVGWMNDRLCYGIQFADGKCDIWPVDDPAARYEFRPFTDLVGMWTVR